MDNKARVLLPDFEANEAGPLAGSSDTKPGFYFILGSVHVALQVLFVMVQKPVFMKVQSDGEVAAEILIGEVSTMLAHDKAVKYFPTDLKLKRMSRKFPHLSFGNCYF